MNAPPLGGFFFSYQLLGIVWHARAGKRHSGGTARSLSSQQTLVTQWNFRGHGANLTSQKITETQWYLRGHGVKLEEPEDLSSQKINATPWNLRGYGSTPGHPEYRGDTVKLKGAQREAGRSQRNGT